MTDAEAIEIFGTTWPDERIDAKLADISNRTEHGFDIDGKCYRFVTALMRQMLADLTTTIDAQAAEITYLKEQWKQSITNNGELVTAQVPIIIERDQLQALLHSQIATCETLRAELAELRQARVTTIIRTDSIVCPTCEKVQNADVTHTVGHPFPTFVHECSHCGYVIMESEWQTVSA